MDRAGTFGVGLAAATLAVSLGVVTLASLGAPQSHMTLNVAGLVAGGGLGGLMLMKRGLLARGLLALALAGGAAILATAHFGISLEGVRRWVRAGPLLLHVGLIALPFVVAQAARQAGWPSALAITAALAGTALQPDAQTATALAAGVVAIAMLRPSRLAWIMAALGVATAAWCWTRPDPLPAVTYVEGVVPLAFARSQALGLLASAGLALPALALVGFGLADKARRIPALALAAASAGVAAASLLGKYPTPLVGYGLSPILSYVLCWTVLAALTQRRRPSSMS